MSTLTIEVPDSVKAKLARASARTGERADALVLEGIERVLWLRALDESRRALAPSARELGITTDEDVFRLIS